jgi:hypothetical protein
MKWGSGNFKSCNSMGALKWSYSVTSTCFGLCQMLANILDSYDHFWAKYSMSDEISKNNYILLESFIPPLLDG